MMNKVGAIVRFVLILVLAGELGAFPSRLIAEEPTNHGAESKARPPSTSPSPFLSLADEEFSSLIIRSYESKLKMALRSKTLSHDELLQLIEDPFTLPNREGNETAAVLGSTLSRMKQLVDWQLGSDTRRAHLEAELRKTIKELDSETFPPLSSAHLIYSEPLLEFENGNGQKLSPNGRYAVVWTGSDSNDRRHGFVILVDLQKGSILMENRFEQPVESRLVTYSMNGRWVFIPREGGGFTVYSLDSGKVILNKTDPEYTYGKSLIQVAANPKGDGLLVWKAKGYPGESIRSLQASIFDLSHPEGSGHSVSLKEGLETQARWVGMPDLPKLEPTSDLPNQSDSKILDKIAQGILEASDIDDRSFYDSTEHELVVESRSGNKTKIPTGKSRVISYALSEDGKRLAALSFNNQIRVWDVARQKLLQQYPSGVGREFSTIQISADGRRITAAGWSKPGKLKLSAWDIP